jgi:hypothetical protein
MFDGKLNDQILALIRELVIFKFGRDSIKSSILRSLDTLVLVFISIPLASSPVKFAELFTGMLGLYPSRIPLRGVKILSEVDSTRDGGGKEAGGKCHEGKY